MKSSSGFEDSIVFCIGHEKRVSKTFFPLVFLLASLWSILKNIKYWLFRIALRVLNWGKTSEEKTSLE